MKLGRESLPWHLNVRALCDSWDYRPARTPGEMRVEQTHPESLTTSEETTTMRLRRPDNVHTCALSDAEGTTAS